MNQSKSFSIKKTENNSIISIDLYKPNKILLRSIVEMNILVGPSLNNSFSNIQFIGNSVVTLYKFINNSQRLSYNLISRLIWCISQQQKILEGFGYGMFSLTLEDIVVVNGYDFFCINPYWIATISSEKNNNKFITFNSPFIRNEYSSPEIKAITKLPASISLNSFYYSLGSLAFYCFFKKQFDYTDCSNSLLQTISNTKLYWFFKRALEINVEKRCILFI